MKVSYLVAAILAALAVVVLGGDDYKEMNANRSPTREHEDVAWCMSKTTCETCVKGVSCIWCPEQGPNGGCFHGKPWGAIDHASIAKCKSYKYLQCKIPGMVLLVLVCAAALLLLILLLLCICCCCCCRKRRSPASTYAMLPASERYGDGTSSADRLVSSSSVNHSSSDYSAHPVTDARRREMNEKYNKYRSPAESYY